MELLYRIAADALAVLHFAFVAFVALGLLAILIVVAEALCGITCPLTLKALSRHKSDFQFLRPAVS